MSQGSGLSRRTMLKRIGAGTAIAWSAPVLSSLRTPAFAGYPPPPDGGCIVLPQRGQVDATVTLSSHANSLEFGLASPVHVVVCAAPCFGVGASETLGTFDAGTNLRFYLTDVTCDETFVCPHIFSRVIQTSPTTWQICFDDAGGGCVHHDPPCHCNVCADITLTPS
jgi:hypothetical protein